MVFKCINIINFLTLYQILLKNGMVSQELTSEMNSTSTLSFPLNYISQLHLQGVVYGKIGDMTIVVRRKGWLNKPTIDINKKNNNPANAGFTNDADTIMYKD